MNAMIPQHYPLWGCDTDAGEDWSGKTDEELAAMLHGPLPIIGWHESDDSADLTPVTPVGLLVPLVIWAPEADQVIPRAVRFMRQSVRLGADDPFCTKVFDRGWL